MEAPRVCIQRSEFGWYGITFDPAEYDDVLVAFKEVILEVDRRFPEFALVRIDTAKYEEFVKIVLERCHFSTPQYYMAGIVWGPETVAQKETKPAAGTERGA